MPPQTDEHPFVTLLGPGAILVAAVALVWLFTWQAAPALGIGAVSRLRVDAVRNALERSESTSGHPGHVYVLGSSVAGEGIDAAIAEAAAPGWECRNFSVQLAGLYEFWILSASVARARPACCCCCVTYAGFDRDATPQPAFRDAAAIDRMIDLDADRDVFAAMSTRSRRELERNPVEVVWTIRDDLRIWLDESFRNWLRRDLRTHDMARNFRDPWQRRVDMQAAALRRHIGEILKERGQPAFDDGAGCIVALDHAIARLTGAGVRVALVMAPEQAELLDSYAPEFRAAVDGYLDGRIRQYGPRLAVVRHSALLDDPAYWSDATHPNAAGRQRWSTALGAGIASGFARE